MKLCKCPCGQSHEAEVMRLLGECYWTWHCPITNVKGYSVDGAGFPDGPRPKNGMMRIFEEHNKGLT